MPKTTEEPTRARKSINELTDTVERSGERVSSQLNSALLAWVGASTDVFVSAVQFAADVAEAGAERLSGGLLCGTASDGSSTYASRVMKSQKETVAEAVRIHHKALKRSMDIAQGSLDRIVEKTSATPAPAAE